MQGVAGEEVEAWLRGVPWAAMPELCRPDTHFKDADSERQRLRTTRKHVQARLLPPLTAGTAVCVPSLCNLSLQHLFAIPAGHSTALCAVPELCLCKSGARMRGQTAIVTVPSNRV